MSPPNGSIDPLVDVGRDRLAKVYDGWADQILKSTDSSFTDDEVTHRALVVLHSLKTSALSRQIYATRLHAAMTGALDTHYELERDLEHPVQMATPHTLATATPNVVDAAHRFTLMPFEDAIAAFMRRSIVTKSKWLRLTGKEQRASFTIANVSRLRFIEVVRDHLAEQMRTGLSPKLFRETLPERLKEAGFSSLNPSHAETVFRNAVAKAYNEGRREQMTEPAVLESHPFWELRGVRDSTTRPTHRACFGVILPATDPVWARAYPPLGHRCRCGVLARRVGPAGVTSADYPQLEDVPDEGWS